MFSYRKTSAEDKIRIYSFRPSKLGTFKPNGQIRVCLLFWDTDEKKEVNKKAYRFYICDKWDGPRNRISQTFTTKLSVIFNNRLKCNFLVFCNAAEQISENYLETASVIYCKLHVREVWFCLSRPTKRKSKCSLKLKWWKTVGK